MNIVSVLMGPKATMMGRKEGDQRRSWGLLPEMTKKAAECYLQRRLS